MRAIIRHLPVVALFLYGVSAPACPICQGWGTPSPAQRFATTPQAVLAVPTADAGRFRVTQVIKGERPADGVVEGDYPRRALNPGKITATEARPLLLLRDDPLPTWVILGEIDAGRGDWLRALATAKPAADMSPDEWSSCVALTVPYLNDPEPLAAELAATELAAAPYVALRTAKPHLDAAALRRCLADPALAMRHPLAQILLGICGTDKDAAALERRLQAGDSTNLSAVLAAILELRGPKRMAWVETSYLVDPKRSPLEIKAALLALSVHGTANRIPRERVIQAYRMFMKAHPDIAGEVAADFAAWQYWDAVPDYNALLASKVPQQYPSRMSIMIYLQQYRDAAAASAVPETAPAAGNAERSK